MPLREIHASKPADSKDAELSPQYTFGRMFVSDSPCLPQQAGSSQSFPAVCPHKAKQWEACSKGIREDLCLISLRGLISKIISHTEQKELPNDLWVSQLLPILVDVAENWLRLLIQKSSSRGSWGHTDTQLVRGKHRPYPSHRVAEQQPLKSCWPD